MKIKGIIKNRRGVSTLEYAVLISVVVTALVGVSIVVQRAICGKFKQSADVFGHGAIYSEPETSIEP